MKPIRIISLCLVIFLLFMTVSCDESPNTIPATSNGITTTQKDTTPKKTTTTTTKQSVVIVHPKGSGNVRRDCFHYTAAERSAETGWVNLNHLLAIDDTQKALFDGDSSTTYSDWENLLNSVAFAEDVQLWAVEITFANASYNYYSSFLVGYITVELGNDYNPNFSKKPTVTYWGREEVNGKLMIQLPQRLYWEAKEAEGPKILKSGDVIMDVSGMNDDNPIVDIQFYGTVVE